MEQWRKEQPELPILHTHTPWLPYRGMGRHDYLLCDAPWHFLVDMFHVPARLASHQSKLMEETYQGVHRVFTTSEWARWEIIQTYGLEADKVIAVGTGCGPFEPYHGPKDYGNGVTLFVGKQRFEEKGGRLLIEAFRIAYKSNPSLQLVMVVDKNERIGTHPGHRIMSNISWDVLTNLYRNASLYAMPAMLEPWGLVYIEAQLARVPLLGLERAAFPELSFFGRSGFLVPEPTPEAIAESLLSAHSDPDRLAAMGREGQRLAAERFTWDCAADRILATLQ
ncbi:MAG: alpha-maltose-phosphate synthase [Thermomicrobiales bacterium]|nr:alpha-maltose-phosphate synthase [Thermomicrobiales bacterium]